VSVVVAVLVMATIAWVTRPRPEPDHLGRWLQRVWRAKE